MVFTGNCSMESVVCYACKSMIQQLLLLNRAVILKLPLSCNFCICKRVGQWNGAFPVSTKRCGTVRCVKVQLGVAWSGKAWLGLRFHHWRYTDGLAAFKPDGDRCASYVSIVMSSSATECSLLKIQCKRKRDTFNKEQQWRTANFWTKLLCLFLFIPLSHGSDHSVDQQTAWVA